MIDEGRIDEGLTRSDDETRDIPLSHKLFKRGQGAGGEAHLPGLKSCFPHLETN